MSGPTCSLSSLSGAPYLIELTALPRSATGVRRFCPRHRSCTRRWVLAGVVEARHAHAGDHRLQVGIVEHDDRRLAAELRCVRLTLATAASITFCPVATLPVTDTMRTPGWLMSGDPTLGPRPVTTFTTPAGYSSAHRRASLSVVSGVCLDRA